MIPSVISNTIQPWQKHPSVKRASTLAALALTMGLVLFLLVGPLGNGNAVGEVIAWPNNNVPSGLTNVVAIAAGDGHNLALKRDGTVAAWGTYWDGSTFVPATVPVGLSNVVAIAAGDSYGLALQGDGTVAAWGVSYNGTGVVPMTVPPGLSNVMAIAAGRNHSLALRTDGRVIAWGNYTDGETNVPADLSNVVAIAGGFEHSLALTDEGRVVAWGNFGNDVPAGLSDVVAIAAGSGNLALKADGRMVAWNYRGELETNVPPDLANVVTIASGPLHKLALRADGTVVAWGDTTGVWTNVPSRATNVVAIAAGWSQNLALIGDGSPAFLSQPGSRRLFTGRDYALLAVATGSEPLSYQWSFNGSNLPGATQSSLPLPSVQLTNAGAYRVMISNSLGSAVSRPAILRVVQSPPLISTLPASQPLHPGDNFILRVTADGSGPLRYQWRFNGAALSGATNAALFISNAAYNNAGTYMVVISNPLGSITSDSIQLFLPLEYDFNAPNGPLIWYPTSIQSSTSRTYTVTFDPYHFKVVESSCTSSLTLDPATRIFRGTESCYDLEEDYYYFLFGWQPGPVHSTNYSIPVSQPAPDWLDGHWKLDLQVVPNGNQLSGQAFITLDNSNVLEFQLTGTNSPTTHKLMLLLQDSVGDNLTVRTYGPDQSIQSIKGNVASQVIDFVATNPLALVVYGSGTVQAFTNGQALVLGNDYTLTATPRPGNLFSNWVVGDIVTNGATLQFTMSSNLAITAIFVTNLPPALTVQPQSQTVIAGTNVTFSARASGTPPLKLQWRLNGVNIPGATNADYFINNVQPVHAGNYSMVAANSAGTAISTAALLTVLLPPVITLQPQSQSVKKGASVSFTVAATGTTPLNYQWKFNGVTIPGAAAASYALTSVQPSNAGIYTVVVSNLTRRVATGTASLYVSSPLMVANSTLTSNGRFQGQLIGLAANTYVVQASSNLTSWVSIATNTSATGIITFTDTNRISFGHRFYRAHLLDRQTPTLTISAPTPGQRWSDAVFNVKGTASDDLGVASVWYQLNGTTWALATSTNGFTNWTASVTLAPGTNTAKAYAVDVVGNHSTTSSVSLVYVATNRLQVRMVGQGILSPNYSNAWLEIGRGYSMAAGGVNGHVFSHWLISTNWAGGALSSNLTLNFLMQSNLTLEVDFADVTKPTVAITTPAPNARLSNAVVTVKGTASDNALVGGVWYQLNGAGWASALSTNGWTNWLATVVLIKGTNIVRAYSVDASGNTSTTNSISFVSSFVSGFASNLRLVFNASRSSTSGGPELSLDASIGLSGRIEVSTNLVNWTSLITFVGTNSPLYFRDPAFTNNDRRFYRAVIP